MDAIDKLMSEHQLILQALSALSVYADRLDAGDGAEPGDLATFVEFIREWADRRHHNKEEKVLFEAMIANGFPREGGPVGMMLYEHDVGRGYVKEMSEVAESPTPWAPEAIGRATQASRNFVALLRQHIAKEDGMLYQMARNRLPPEVIDDVNTRCAEADAARDAAVDTAIEEAVAKLAERYTT